MNGARLFQIVLGDRTRGSGHKSKRKKFHMNTRNNFFALSLASTGKRCPRFMWSLPLRRLTHPDAFLWNLVQGTRFSRELD